LKASLACRISGNSITFESLFETNTTNSHPTTSEFRTLTFAELKDLLEQGKTDQIPNNKHIPEAINASPDLLWSPSSLTNYNLSQNAPPSESMAQARKKPWEITVE
jgi:hypothetical protein